MDYYEHKQMWNTERSIDFDIQLSEILLIHKNRFIPSFCFTEYKNGRNSDGFVFCISGTVTFQFADYTLKLNAGQLLFLPHNSAYDVFCDETETEPFIHDTINFRIADFHPTDGHLFADIISGKCLYMSDPERSELFAEPFARALSVWQSKKNGYRVMARSILYELLYLYLMNANHTMLNSNYDQRLRPAKRILEEHFEEPVELATLASLCGMSVSHFRRTFRAMFGLSPMEYRREKCMLRAKDLLLSGLYTVAETANEVGFSDPNYFSRVFRSRYGMTPSEFMKN